MFNCLIITNYNLITIQTAKKKPYTLWYRNTSQRINERRTKGNLVLVLSKCYTYYTTVDYRRLEVGIYLIKKVPKVQSVLIDVGYKSTITVILVVSELFRILVLLYF